MSAADAALAARLDPADCHDNAAVYLRALAGVDQPHLVHGLSQGLTVNHIQGYHAAALAQVRAAVERRVDRPEHTAALDAAVGTAIDFLERERRQGQCLAEVLSSTYWPFSALFRGLAWRETMLLLTRLPDHRGLRELAGQLMGWFRFHRTLLDGFTAHNGLVHHPGIRCKHDPREYEFASLLADDLIRPVTDPTIRRALDKIDAERDPELRHRPHEILARRLYRTPELRRLFESLGEERTSGRLSTPVGLVRPEGGRALAAVMPTIHLTHESAGRPHSVVFEVAVDGTGAVERRLLEHPEARPGTEVRHPNGATIQSGATIFGPRSSLYAVEPWAGDPRGGGRRGGGERSRLLSDEDVTFPAITREGVRPHTVAIVRAAAAMAEAELDRQARGEHAMPELTRLVRIYQDRFAPSILEQS